MTEQPQTESQETPKQNRRRSNLVIFSLIVAAVFAVSYRPSVKAIYCDTSTAPDNPDVIMLATTWCPYCYKARKYFLHNQISYCEFNIEDNGKGESMYTEINRHLNTMGMPLGIPILYIGEYQFSGFEESRIEQALATLKP